MRLATPSGPIEFEVRAVVVDYSSELGAGFIDRELYVDKWGDEAIDVVNLYLTPEADRPAVAAQVRKRLGGGDAIFVSETTELREQYLSLVHKSFAYTRSLELIVLLIALMGVVGTLIAAVLDRVRELGILRAVGARRGQVVRALVTEAAFLGFCAAVAGVAAGAAHCALFLRTLVAGLSGWHLPFVFPTEGALRIAVFVVVTAAVAGLVPGIRAARLDIKDALAHE
jgi:putative ABC transport system permease protein